MRIEEPKKDSVNANANENEDEDSESDIDLGICNFLNDK